MLRVTLFLLLFSFVSCSTHPVPQKGVSFVPTEAYQSNQSNQVTIAVVGMNDFHGTLLAKERKLPNGTVIKCGGAATLAAYIKILREEMKGRVLFVDAGDEWQGTLESNQAKGGTVVQFFNRLKIDVAAIGNHEFDFSVPNLETQMGAANYPYVASNIYVKKTGKRVAWKNTKPSHLFDVGGIKIGVIGVTTTHTPGTTRYEYVSHLDFKNPIKPVTEESKKLRAQGAQLVLVTAHAGSVCRDPGNLRAWNLWSEASQQGSCEEESEINRLAKGLKPGVIDGIIAGHTHQVMHHFIEHLPVVQDEAYNQFFNIIYYTFDLKTKKVIPELTRIEGLIPICQQVFQGTDHCDVRRLAKEESPSLVDATFHGKKIRDDEEVLNWLNPIRESTEKYRNQVLAISELPLTHFRDKEGALGNLVADVLRSAGNADFSLVNSGGIRTPLDSGSVTFDALYRALPFDNTLNVVTLTGKQVKLLYQIATAGSHGIIGVSGLKITLIPYQKEVDRIDLNRDGKKENWEGLRLVKIETSDGKQIQDHHFYRVATYDFLVNGGDDLSWFMKQIPDSKIKRMPSTYCRELVADYLKKTYIINTKANPLVNPDHPRIFFTQ